jgi:hypothetical protein
MIYFIISGPIKISIQLDKKIEKAYKLDGIDYKIICQLILSSDNKNISSTSHIALSTIQRRRRLLFTKIIIENLLQIVKF